MLTEWKIKKLVKNKTLTQAVYRQATTNSLRE